MPILGFHSHDPDHSNGCHPPSLCRSSVNNSKMRVREFEMDHCTVVACGSKSGKNNEKFSKIPKIVSNRGEEWEEWEELTRREEIDGFRP